MIHTIKLPPQLIRFRYQHDDSAYWNLLTPFLTPMEWSENGTRYEIAFRFVLDERKPVACFRVQIGGCHFFFTLHKWPASGFFTKQSQSFHTLPHAMAAAVLEIAMEETLSSLEEILGTKICVSSVPIPTLLEPGNLQFGFQWSRRDEDLNFSGNIIIPEDSRKEILHLLEHRRATTQLWSSLLLSFGLCIGQATLTIGQLRAIRPGDVIFCDTPIREKTLLLLLSPRCRAFGRFEHKQFTIQSIMETPSMATSPDTSFCDADEIPIELFFEVGSATMPLGQLRKLAPGSIIECPNTDLDSPITIKVQGGKVARGELVMAGDRLAIRLIQIFQKSGDTGA